jgi:tetratricopeptide (TPR) repeat protein
MNQRKKLSPQAILRMAVLAVWIVCGGVLLAQPLQAMLLRAKASAELYALLAQMEPPFSLAHCPLKGALLPDAQLDGAREALLGAITADAAQAQAYWLWDLLNCIDARAGFGSFQKYAQSLPGDPRGAILNIITQPDADVMILAIQSEPAFSVGEVILLYNFLKEKYPEESGLPIFLSLVDRYPENTELWQLMVQDNWSLMQTVETGIEINYIQTLIDTQDKWGVSVIRSELYMQLGRMHQAYKDPRDPASAARYYNLALADIASLPNYRQPSLHVYLGEAYRTLEYPVEDTLAEFEAALVLQEDSYAALYDLGALYLTQLENIPQARYYFYRMIELQPENPAGVYWLGYSYEVEGNIPEAKRFYNEALDIQPDFGLALKRMEALK